MDKNRTIVFSVTWPLLGYIKKARTMCKERSVEKQHTSKRACCIFETYADHTLIENYMFSNRTKLDSNAALQVMNECIEALASPL